MSALDDLAGHWDARYREFSEAANAEPDLDRSRAQRAIGVAYRKCAEQLRAITGKPDEPDPAGPVRYALVEQMGHRATTGTVRETTFCGRPMLEVTALDTGRTHLVAPESLYEITWLTETEARQRAKPWTARALPAAGDTGDTGDLDEDDEDDEDDDPSGERAYHLAEAAREALDDLHGDED